MQPIQNETQQNNQPTKSPQVQNDSSRLKVMSTKHRHIIPPKVIESNISKAPTEQSTTNTVNNIMPQFNAAKDCAMSATLIP